LEEAREYSVVSVELTPALIGLAGIVVGGAIQASVQFLLARRSHLRTQKSEAYLKYFKGLSAASYAKTDEDRVVARQILAEGQGLVALYGSTKAIDALAALRRLGDTSVDRVAQVISAMREDVVGFESSLDSSSLYEILFIDEKITQ
jgi:hypothetical protein